MVIYIVQNILTKKVYIGQTIKPLKERVRQHKDDSKWKGKSPCPYFHQSLQKYGFENFTWSILEEVETKEKLDIRERFWIKVFRSNNPKYGYNLTEGGQGGNYEFTEIDKQNISKGHKGWFSRLPPEEQERQRQQRRSQAKKQWEDLTENEKKSKGEFFSKINKGRIHTEQELMKMSESKSEWWSSLSIEEREEIGNKMSNGKYRRKNN